MFFFGGSFFFRRTRRMVIILIKVNIILISAAGAKILGYIASLHSYIADQLNALTAYRGDYCRSVWNIDGLRWDARAPPQSCTLRIP